MTFLNRQVTPHIPYARVALGVLLVLGTIGTAGLVTLLQTKIVAYSDSLQSTLAPATKTAAVPFPVGVDANAQTIVENPSVDTYLNHYLADSITKPVRLSWMSNLTHKLASLSWYQTLASPSTRILVIWPGDRREQVVNNFSQILHWNNTESQQFSDLVTKHPPALPDGTFFPGRYIVASSATPDVVATMVNERFSSEVTSRYQPSVSDKVPMNDAMVIASLLEREAYSFEDMRLISGIIWNRLFADMPLQLDASLQYAKTQNGTYGNTWWPRVMTKDKFIDSPYNTYSNKGLPPGPIANPSAEAILAALNPTKTTCLFYFHDSSGIIHCSDTYAEHTAKLKQLYGQGH